MATEPSKMLELFSKGFSLNLDDGTIVLGGFREENVTHDIGDFLLILKLHIAYLNDLIQDGDDTEKCLRYRIERLEEKLL